MKTLFEIEHEINDVLTAFADTDEGGVDPEQYENFISHVRNIIDEIGQDEKRKIDAYGHFVTKLESERERLATIIKNLQNRKKSVECKIEGIKNHLLFVMNTFGKPKIEGEVFVARITKSEQVEITEEKLLPDEYMRVKKEPDKTLIKDAIKNGTDVPGARIRPNQSVTIK